jgi:hypothetical protein
MQGTKMQEKQPLKHGATSGNMEQAFKHLRMRHCHNRLSTFFEQEDVNENIASTLHLTMIPEMRSNARLPREQT